MPVAPAQALPQQPRFNLILQPEFPLNALILASDALRIANQNSGLDLFAWSFVSEDGEPVRASNGMWFDADCSIENMPQAEVYLVFEGNLPTQNNSPKLLNQLRAAARFGAVVGGVDTGAFALAQAGLIGSQRGETVLHWEAVPTFHERFPDSGIADQIYLIGNNRACCAGGVATLDMVLDLISQFADQAIANEVANALIHERREPNARQRSDADTETEEKSLPRRILRLMEQNLDFPLTLEELAEKLEISQRTLARVCQRTFGEPPMRLYLHIRLQAARNILFYEEFAIKEVALACGFSYPAVFSRAFRAQFGQSPSAFRRAWRERQAQSVRPEIRRLITPALPTS